MFNQFKTLICIAVSCLILGLCVWLWYQSNIISSLRAENQTQAQTIAQQQQANQQLKDNLAQERQAVENQQRIASELRNKVELTQNEIKSILTKDTCAKTALPNGIADSLKRLHKQGDYKN
ncbi:DUF2570 family protein [Mannheimia cairinae]|uniref:DUF2570 family protein n=1 Tax=Mannheimia cairinae TaxID=3025936 RepID=UPI002361488F|nr:DUF2570 family protein [Mannheimia cairinae]MDD0826427.1 DUF2570 family protein [Mannheimia cairinae]